MKALAFWAMLALAADSAAAQEGKATVYGNEHGQLRRADGHPYHPWEVGCAHRTLPLGSVHRVTNLGNGRSIMCRIDDRGPYSDAILDLSFGAARELGIGTNGSARVRIE